MKPLIKNGLVDGKYPYVEYDDGSYLVYTYYRNTIIKVNKDQFNENKILNVIHKNSLDIEIRKCGGDFSDCVELVICLTNACNLRCKYCFIGEEGKIFKYISKESIDKSLEAAKELASIKNKKSIFIQFFGGEPTLCIDLMKYSIYKAKEILSDFTLEFGLTTNGVFDKDAADFLIDNHYVVAISMDGLPKYQNEQRIFANGHVTSEKVENTIKYFTSKNVFPFIRITITKKMIEDFRETIDYLHNLGVKTVHLEPVTMGGRANDGDSIIRPESNKFCDALIDAIEYAKTKGMFIINSSLLKAASPCNSFCDAIGKNKLAVTYEGVITSCLGVQSIEHPLAKQFIMDNCDVKKWIKREFRAKIKNVKNKKCKDCFAKYVCGGGCPSRNYYANKDIDIVDEMHCTSTKRMFDYYIKMLYRKQKGEKNGSSKSRRRQLRYC